MKSFKQFRENIEIDQKRLELQKDASQQRLRAQDRKRKREMEKRMDELERTLPDKTADEVMDRLGRN